MYRLCFLLSVVPCVGNVGEGTLVQVTGQDKSGSWWQIAWSHGSRAFLERMDETILAEFKRQAIELILQEKTGRGIPDTWHILYFRGRKAD